MELYGSSLLDRRIFMFELGWMVLIMFVAIFSALGFVCCFGDMRVLVYWTRGFLAGSRAAAAGDNRLKKAATQSWHERRLGDARVIVSGVREE